MSAIAQDLWRDVRESLLATSPPAAKSWIEQIQPRRFVRGVFEVAVPNEVVHAWVEGRHLGDLENALRAVTGAKLRVRVLVDPSLPRVLADPLPEPPDHPRDRLRGRGDRLARSLRGDADEAAPWVVVPEVKVAHAAVRRLLDEPESGNPLFLYGPPGVGKSALVEHHLRRFRADAPGGAKVTVRVAAEHFSRSFVRALREGALAAFRGRLLAADVFVFEEAHRLRGKSATQREFTRILLYHLRRGRPVILTSRHPPHGIFLLEEGLRSHFLGGMIVRLADPGEPSRRAILSAHARRFAEPVPDETLERIVRRVAGSPGRQVRYLEKAAAFARAKGLPATLDVLVERFPELAGSGHGELDVDGLVRLVAEAFDVAPAEVASNKKTRRAALARHVVVYLATEIYGVPSRRILRHLGGLAPSTTSYARRRVAAKRREDPAFDRRLGELCERIGRGQRLLF